MTYLEMSSILSKQWANVKDIQKISSCGRDKATLVLNNIRNDILNSGFNLPVAREKLVPMRYVIKYFGLDSNYIYDMAEKEKRLKS